MKNWGARRSYIRRICLNNVCHQESCPAPEKLNSSEDMNVQLVSKDKLPGDMDVQLVNAGQII